MCFLKCMELQFPEKQTSVFVVESDFNEQAGIKKTVSKYKSKINKTTKCHEFL